MLNCVQDEMWTYADERSEAWRQIGNAAKTEDRMQALEPAIDTIRECLNSTIITRCVDIFAEQFTEIVPEQEQQF